MPISEERAFEECARLSEIRAELADLQDQAMALGQETQRLMDEKGRLLQTHARSRGFPRRKRMRGCLRAAG